MNDDTTPAKLSTSELKLIGDQIEKILTDRSISYPDALTILSTIFIASCVSGGLSQSQAFEGLKLGWDRIVLDQNQLNKSH